MRRADFHLHTWCSDGALPPTQLRDLVLAQRLDYWAVTDHDTLAGWRALVGTPGLVCGVEVTACDAGQEVHLVALGINPSDTSFSALLANIREQRRVRLAAVLDRLPRTVRRGLTLDDLRDRRAPEASEALGRFHLASALVRQGGISTRREAFEQYIGDEHLSDPDLPGFPPVADVGEAIRAAGGVAILAHPGVFRSWPRVEALMAMGLDGAEADHPGLDPTIAAGIRYHAAQDGWLCSLGTDLHAPGTRQPGHCHVADHLLRPLLERLESKHVDVKTDPAQLP